MTEAFDFQINGVRIQITGWTYDDVKKRWEIIKKMLDLWFEK